MHPYLPFTTLDFPFQEQGCLSVWYCGFVESVQTATGICRGGACPPSKYWALYLVCGARSWKAAINHANPRVPGTQYRLKKSLAFFLKSVQVMQWK